MKMSTSANCRIVVFYDKNN